jgi:hypothetical protein
MLGTVLGLGLASAVLAPIALPAGAANGARVTNSQFGFSLVLPAGWNQISLDPTHLGDVLGPHAKVSSSLHQTLTTEAATEASKGVAVFAFLNKRDKDGFFPNLRVSPQKGFLATISQLEGGLRAGLARAGATSTSVKVVRYPSGRAVVGTYAQGNPNKPADKVWGVQIYVVHGSNLLVLTLASTNRTQVDQAGTTVSSTLRFT